METLRLDNETLCRSLQDCFFLLCELRCVFDVGSASSECVADPAFCKQSGRKGGILDYRE